MQQEQPAGEAALIGLLEDAMDRREREPAVHTCSECGQPVVPELTVEIPEGAHQAISDKLGSCGRVRVWLYDSSADPSLDDMRWRAEVTL